MLRLFNSYLKILYCILILFNTFTTSRKFMLCFEKQCGTMLGDELLSIVILLFDHTSIKVLNSNKLTISLIHFFVKSFIL